MAGSERKLAVVAALVGNLAIAALKLVAAIVSGSAAMFAEAAHSFSDCGNQILLLVGISRSKRPPSPRYPYGTGKAAYFWPFMVAMLLFGVAGAYSFFEGIEKIRDPHPLGDVRLSIVILSVSFVIEAASIMVGLREARHAAKEHGIRTIREFLSENRDASLLTVLVEDGLALLGLPIAAGAILLASYTGNGVWDGVGSLLIGLLLMGFAFFLARAVHGLLLGTGLSTRDLTRVHEVLSQEPCIERVLSVESMYLGPHTVLLGATVDMRDDLKASEVETILARVRDALTTALPVLKFVYLHPKTGHQ